MKHTKVTSALRRGCALLLVAALSLPLPALANQGESKIQTQQELLEGLTYTNTVSQHTAGRNESFTLTLEDNSRVFPILLQSSGTVYGAATINAAVKRAQEMGYQVLGAVNTDFFATSTGVPQGIVIEDGVYKSDSVGNPAILIDGMEVTLCEEPQVSLTLTNRTTDTEIIPNYFNKYRASTGGVYLLNEHFSTQSTRTSGAGWFVRMKVVDYDAEDPAYALTVNSELELEVTELLQSDQPLVIGPGEYILTASDVSNKLSVYQSFQLGDRITLTTRCDDPDLSDAQWAGGVGDTILEQGAITPAEEWTMVANPTTTKAPRTALGVRRDGTLVLYAVDGRKASHSVGLTISDLASQMLELDCRWAVNLDGGGSTSATVWLPGREGPALLNSPSDGRPRSCATFLLLVTDREGNGRPERLALREDGLVVLTGSQAPLAEAVVLDDTLNILEDKAEDLTITSRTGLGDITDEGIYIAGDHDGTDQLRLRSRDLDITGEAQIHVVEELSSLTITADGKEASSLVVKPGQSVQLGASGTYFGRPALRSIHGVEVTLDESVGAVDENGLLTFSETAVSGGTVTFSAGGLEKVLPITVRSVHNDVTQEHWGYTAVEYCYDNNIVSGVSPTEFGANGLIRRADFMLMLYAAMGRPAVSTPCTFTDVAESDYFYTALAWAQSLGLISGTGDGSCAALSPITREQAFTILRRALPLLNKVCPDAPLSALDQFSDRDSIADYAKVPAATLVAQGVVSGAGGVINPKNNLTRVEMAALLYKISTYTPITEYPDLTPDPVVPEVPEAPETPTTPETPELPEAPAGFPLPIRTQLGAVTNAEAGLKVRSGPGTDHEQVSKLANDQKAVILGQTEGWYHILYPTEEKGVAMGYVSADYFTPVDMTTVTTPFVLPENTLLGTVINAEAGLKVRSGPGTDHEQVSKLTNGQQAVVLGQSEGWYHILYPTQEQGVAMGYVSADYMTLPQ